MQDNLLRAACVAVSEGIWALVINNPGWRLLGKYLALSVTVRKISKIDDDALIKPINGVRLFDPVTLLIAVLQPAIL